jgi:hypothetical protein
VGYTAYETDVRSLGRGARVAAQLSWLEPMPPEISARLVVHTDAAGVLTTLDGRRIGTDGSDTLPPGEHRLRVVRADYMPVEREVSLAPGRTVEMDAHLVPTPAARHDRIQRLQIAGWVTAGLSAAVLAGGAIWFGVNESQLQADYVTYNRDADLFHHGGALGNRLDAFLAAMQNIPNEENFRIASAIIGGVGLVGTLVGLGIVVWAPHTDSGEQAPWLRVRTALNGFALEGRF